MNLTAQRIMQAIKQSGMSYGELSKRTGIPKSSLQRYATGENTNIPLDRIEAIALATGVKARWLTGWDKTETRNENFAEGEEPTPKKGVRVPVYGNVAAGIPIEAITDIEDYEEIPEEMARGGEYIALKIHGDSMEPRMQEGDVVIVHLQETIENGEIAVVSINRTETTCKKVKKTPDGIMLLSINPSYDPMYYSNKEIEELPITILGKVVELRAKF